MGTPRLPVHDGRWTAHVGLPSPREAEVLALLARGLSNKQIAAELVLADQTVKNHLTGLLRKLGVRNRTMAVVAAIAAGWLDPLEVVGGARPKPLCPACGRPIGDAA